MILDAEIFLNLLNLRKHLLRFNRTVFVLKLEPILQIILPPFLFYPNVENWGAGMEEGEAHGPHQTGVLLVSVQRVCWSDAQAGHDISECWMLETGVQFILFPGDISNFPIASLSLGSEWQIYGYS